MKKYLGQHLLIDEFSIFKIVELLNLQKKDEVFEIGGGTGLLSKEIIKYIDILNIIEIDSKMISILEKTFVNNPKVNIIHKDILQYNFNIKNQKKLRIIGNIPYNITSLILFHLVKDIKFIKDIHLLLQKEVADKIMASNLDKNYGRLSIMLQYHFECIELLEVDASKFYPKPKINSKLLLFIPRPFIVLSKNYNIFYKTVRQAFKYRRKYIKNIFHNVNWKNININSENRVENLSIEDFVKLSNYIYARDRNLCIT